MSESTQGPNFDGLEPIDALMCTLLEGSASADQKQEFLSLVQEDPRFAGQSELLVRLRAAVLGEELDLDVLQEFLGALSAADGWDDFVECLRDESENTKSSVSGELTDSIMAAVDEEGLQFSRLYDGELTAEERQALAPMLEGNPVALAALSSHANLGRLIREAVAEHTRRDDLSGIWAGVAPAIGMPDPEYVEGWEPIGQALAQAVREHGFLEAEALESMASSIMEEVESFQERMERAKAVDQPVTRRWFRWAIPTFALAAAAAALLFVPLIGEGLEAESEDDLSIEYAEMDEAMIEDLEFAEDVLVHVMTEEDGSGPLIIMIDEDAGVLEFEDEDEGVWDTGEAI